MRAAANGKCDVVSDLMSLGADPDTQNNVSESAKLVQEYGCTYARFSYLVAYITH